MHLANLKEYKKNEVVAHSRKIKDYIKDMIKAKGEMKKLYNTVKQVIKDDYMVQILLKDLTQLFVDIYLEEELLTLTK